MTAVKPSTRLYESPYDDAAVDGSSHPTVVWVDDHQFVTDSGSVLLREAGFNVLAAIADGESLLRSYRSIEPDIILCDMALPGQLDGISLTKKLLAEDGRARVVIFSADNSGPLVVEAILSGAVGYLDKTLGVPAVVNCLKQSITEPYVFDPGTLANFIAAVSSRLSGVGEHEHLLSPSDQVILRLLISGEDTNGIANHLHVSVRTAKRALTGLYQSLGVSNRREAIAKAVRESILTDI